MKEIKALQWDNREEGETPLRQMQLIELKLMRVFDFICRKHGLSYQLTGGSVLGAVRHGGFIPWDDDMDVMMPVTDALRFYDIARKELPDDISLRWQVGKMTKSFYPLLKMCDAYSSVYTKQKDFDEGKHVGVSFDIFTFIPYVKDDSFLFKILYKQIRTAMGWYWWLSKYRATKPFVLIWVRSLDWAFRNLNRGEYIAWGHNPFDALGTKFRFPAEATFPSKLIKFEGFEFYGPADPDACLRAQYGDYMTLPPEEERKAHEKYIYPFTKCKNEKALDWPKNHG